MKLKRCRLMDLPTLMTIMPEDDSMALLIMRTKIVLPSVFAMIDEDRKDAILFYEFVSGDICILHVFTKKGTSIKELMKLAKATEEYIRSLGCKIIMAVKENDRTEIGYLIGAGGGERVYEAKSSSKVIYFKE